MMCPWRAYEIGRITMLFENKIIETQKGAVTWRGMTCRTPIASQGRNPITEPPRVE